MRKTLPLLCGVLLALLIPTAANATISTVFNDLSTPYAPLTCDVQSGTNFRYCGTTNGTVVPSWDGTPIDVSVAFPADAGGSDNNFPMVGIFHGWGGTKVNPAASSGNAQTVGRWLAKGYAVFTMTDRGWGGSCGGANPGPGPKAAPCEKGYVHLMHNAYEVRDAQYLMGLLNDDGVINGQKIAATGGSYGGGISAQLGMLKNRIQLANGTLDDWTSTDGDPMQIAAALPDYTWSSMPSSLVPNGSTLDYTAYSPYLGPSGNRRPGITKQSWAGNLNLAGLLYAYYAPTSGTGYPDPAGNMTGWFGAVFGESQFDGDAFVDDMVEELEGNHSSIGIDDSVEPAPMLLANGWNDDLFPVSESVRLYNKIRQDHPLAPVKLYTLDTGHTPRGSTAPGDLPGWIGAQNAWVDYYVNGTGAAPTNAAGGVTAVTSKCSGTTKVAGDSYTASSWAELSPGEVRVAGAAEQSISASSENAADLQAAGVTVCNDIPTTNPSGAAEYESEVAPPGGFTLAGSPTVTATITTGSLNDQVISRLYDVDVAGNTQKLIARGVYRPDGVGAGPVTQTFQLYPQAWTVATGHKLKLELTQRDAPYVQTAFGTPAAGTVKVSNLALRVPTIETPGSLGGFISEQSVKPLPAGYTFSRDVIATDADTPVTTDDVTDAVSPTPVSVTLSVTDDVTGAEFTYYETGANPATPTAASKKYNAAAKPVLQNGEKISYYSVDYAGHAETPKRRRLRSRPWWFRRSCRSSRPRR